MTATPRPGLRVVTLDRFMRYDRRVFRVMRLAAALLVVAAVIAVPIVADLCAFSCETARLSNVVAAPACHHVATTAPRIGETPAPCSHDHHPLVMAAATTAVAARAGLTAAAPAFTTSTATTLSIRRASRIDVAVAWSPPFDLRLATILRI